MVLEILEQELTEQINTEIKYAVMLDTGNEETRNVTRARIGGLISAMETVTKKSYYWDEKGVHEREA